MNICLHTITSIPLETHDEYMWGHSKINFRKIYYSEKTMYERNSL